MFSTSILVILLSGLLHGSWARNIAVSLNLSLDLPQERRPGLSADMLQSCMKETEISMSELNRLRLGELSNDADLMDGIVDGVVDDGAHAPNEQDKQNNNDDDDGAAADDKQHNIVDYDANSPIIYNERNDESLQCFAHCLYEKLGLISNGVFLEHNLFRKLYTILEREKTEVKECLNLESNNKCEAAYKMHLCYNKVKTIEAERRIREILEYDNGDGNDIGLIDGNEEGSGGDTVDNVAACGGDKLADGELDGNPKRNEIERT